MNSIKNLVIYVLPHTPQEPIDNGDDNPSAFGTIPPMSNKIDQIGWQEEGNHTN